MTRMMMTMSRQIFISSTIIAALAVLPIKPVYSAAMFNPVVTCKDMTTEDGESFAACATYYVATPSPMQYPDGHIEYGGGWNHDFTIYTSAAEGLMEGDSDFPQEASANIKVLVRREDNNECTVTVTETYEDDNGATEINTVCISCSYCGDQSGGAYSADCTNIGLGRNVQCESVDTVFFPFTQAALQGLPDLIEMPPPDDEEDEDQEEQEDEEPIFATTYCRCQGRREVLYPPSNTPTDANEFYIINGITVIPLDDNLCTAPSNSSDSTAPSNSNNNERKLQNSNMMGGGGRGMMMNGGMMMDGFLMMNMNMGMGRPRGSGRFVCPSSP